MKLSESVKLYLFVCLLSIPPIIDLFLHPGFPHTSDGTMHLIRHAVYFKEFTGGQFPVRWASQFNYGYGTPIFNFFHPLPYLAGIPFLAAGMSVYQLMKLEFAATYLLSAAGMAALAMALFKDRKKAVLAAILYQYAPFRLVEMHIRGSLGGLYAYALLPYVFLGILHIRSARTIGAAAFCALTAALLSLSHNIVGFVFFGLSVLFAVFFPSPAKTKAVAVTSLFFGLSVAAFFLVPAIIEHKYTYGFLLTKDLFYDHFAPWYLFFIPNPTHAPSLRTAELSVQIGLTQTIALITSAYLLITSKVKGKEKFILKFSVTCFILTFLFMQPVTLKLWENVTFLRQFQFPWRLLAVVNFLTGLSAVSLMSLKVMQNRFVYWSVITITIISTTFYWIPYQGYVNFPLSYFESYPQSTNYFGEVNSIWMAGEPQGFPENRIEVISGSAEIKDISLAPRNHTFTAVSTASSTIVDRTQFYPGWKVTVDGTETPIEFQDQNYRGLITFGVPEGVHAVNVRYGENRLQKLSGAISLISLSVLIAGFVLFAKRKII